MALSTRKGLPWAGRLIRSAKLLARGVPAVSVQGYVRTRELCATTGRGEYQRRRPTSPLLMEIMCSIHIRALESKSSSNNCPYKAYFSL